MPVGYLRTSRHLFLPMKAVNHSSDSCSGIIRTIFVPIGSASFTASNIKMYFSARGKAGLQIIFLAFK